MAPAAMTRILVLAPLQCSEVFRSESFDQVVADLVVAGW
jgi:hypothetical protein